MNLATIKCELVEVKCSKQKSFIVLKELNSHIQHEIVVDESVDRIKMRLMEQYNGDPREGVSYHGEWQILISIPTGLSGTSTKKIVYGIHSLKKMC